MCWIRRKSKTLRSFLGLGWTVMPIASQQLCLLGIKQWFATGSEKGSQGVMADKRSLGLEMIYARFLCSCNASLTVQHCVPYLSLAAEPVLTGPLWNIHPAPSWGQRGPPRHTSQILQPGCFSGSVSHARVTAKPTILKFPEFKRKKLTLPIYKT